MKTTRKTGKNQVSETMLSLSVRKVQLVSIIGLVFILTLGGYIAWAYWYYNSELIAKQSQVDTQGLRIGSLEQQLLALTLQQTALKQDISTNSMTVASKNGEIERLSAELETTKGALSKYQNRFWALKKKYRDELDSTLVSEREKLAATQRVLDTELAKVQQQEAAISSKVSDISEWEKKKADFDKLYANTALVAQNEERVSKLMGQFNQLRVDLDVVNECDKSYLYRYNEAKSILNHIRTFIQKYEMPQDYYFFVISNDSLLSTQNRKLCLVD